MADMLARATTRLQALQQRSAATAITYRRGRASLAFSATRGTSTFTDQDDMGIITIVTSDFIFPVSLIQALDATASLVEPKAGDVIEIAGQGSFQVLGSDNEPPFRYSDPARTQVRVHTKQISTNV